MWDATFRALGEARGLWLGGRIPGSICAAEASTGYLVLGLPPSSPGLCDPGWCPRPLPVPHGRERTTRTPRVQGTQATCSPGTAQIWGLMREQMVRETEKERPAAPHTFVLSASWMSRGTLLG